jgi:O-antigen ligase
VPVRFRSLVLLLSLAIYGLGLYLFYVTYVPMVGPFQAAFLPVLTAVLVITIIAPRKGTLLFITLFPLVNNLPYFFRLYEPLPMAPAALILFLFFFGGWLGSFLLRDRELFRDASLLRPLGLFFALVVLSGAITFWRYANFAPFLSDRIYELVTNAHGVSAGGAIMSVVLNSLNYLTGIAFFVVVLAAFRSEKDARRVMACLFFGAFISISFGLLQHFGHPTLGNNPVSVFLGLVNGTFKDALSFGAYLAMIMPVILGGFFAYRGIPRILSFLLLVLAGGVLMFTGSKVGLLSLPASFCAFALMNFRALRPRYISLRRIHWSAWVVVILILVIIVNAVIFHEALASKFAGAQTIARARQAFSSKSLAGIFVVRADVLWKLAIPMIEDHPLTGLGAGSYIIELSNYARSRRVPLLTPESSENGLLQIASELGVVGLALVLWIFLALAWRTRRGLAAAPPGTRDRFVASGAVAGIIAYLILVQVHTYIGSYEITYLFWLLAAIAIGAGRFEPARVVPGDKAARPARWPMRVALFAIALYGGALLWSSTHSLSLENRTREFGLRQDFGFSQTEKTQDGQAFRWTGRYAGMPLRVDKPSIRIPLHAAHPDIARDPVKVRIFAVRDLFRHKRLIGEAILREDRWESFEYPLADELGQDIILLIEVDRTWNPWKTQKIPDSRDLGVAVGEVTFR